MDATNFDSLQKDIEQRIQQGDFRRAYEKWQQLAEVVDQSDIIMVNLSDLRAEIENAAADKHDEIVQALDTAINPNLPIEEYDVQLVESLLAELERATLVRDLTSSDYGTFEHLHVRRSREKRHRTDYQRIYEQVLSKWEEGERLTRDASNRGQAAILVPFDEALQIATEAATLSSDNKYLSQLVDDAKERRERFAREEEIMTSGGQTGDFVVVLNHISRAGNDEYVMIYDNVGNVLGRFPKDAARQTVIEQARPYVRDRLIVYLDNASAKLKDQNPRSALEELEKVIKFEELRKIVPDIIESAQYDDYLETLGLAQNALQNLERAEAAATVAVEKAATEPKDAWGDFEAALAIYPDSEKHSASLSQARAQLTTRTVSHLTKVIAEMDFSLDQHEYEKVAADADLLLQQYAIVKDIVNTAAIDRIKQRQKQARKMLAARQHAAAKLNDILSLTDQQNTEAAQNQLKDLRSQYDLSLLQQVDLWQTVTERVEGALSIEEKLSALWEKLKTTHRQGVLDAINQAKRNASIQRTADGFGKNENERLRFANEFEAVAQQLEYYSSYLNAESALRSEGHAATIRKINDLIQKHGDNLDKSLLDRFQQRLSDLRREQLLLNNNADILNKVTRALQQSDIKISEILRDLAQVDRFINDDQRQEWVTAVRKSFGSLSVQTPFDLKRLEKIMLTLERLDVVEYDVWSSRLNEIKIAQEARDHKTSRKYKLAKGNWKRLLDAVGDTNREYVITQINNLDAQLLEQERDRLVGAADGTMTESKLNIWRQDVATLVEALKQAVLDATDTFLRLKFMNWAVEVELRYAQKSPENRMRERFDSVGTYAMQQLEPQINVLEAARNRGTLNYPDRDVDTAILEAKKSLLVAQAAPDIGRAVSLVVEDLTVQSPVDRFKNALDTWQYTFEASPPQHPFLEDLDIPFQRLFNSTYKPLQSWFKKHLESLQRILKSIIEEAENQNPDLIAPSVLAAAARLLLLASNDTAGKRVISRLSGLTFELKERFDDMLDSLANARGFEGDQPQQAFLAQRKNIAEQIEYVNLIRRVSEQLPDDVLPDRSPQSIVDLCGTYIRLYENVDDQMHQIQTFTDAFQQALKTFSFDEETFNQISTLFPFQRESYQIAVDEAAQRIIMRLQQIDVADEDFEYDKLERFSLKHPWCQQMIAESVRLQKLYERFVVVITDVKDVIENHNPINNASRIINEYKIDTYNEFRLSKLYKSVKVMLNAQTDEHLTGWAAIVAYVQASVGIFDNIHRWSEPYYTDVDPVPPSRLIVNWSRLSDDTLMQKIKSEQMLEGYFAIYEDELLSSHLKGCLMVEDYADGVKYQVEYLLANGQFEDANDLLGRVLDEQASTKKALKSLLSLAEADAIFANPPLADAGGTTDNYEVAREHAGSEQGRKRLTWMQTHRFRPNRAEKEDAERLRQWSYEIEAEWYNLEDEYRAQLETLDIHVEALEKARLRRNAKKQSVCNALDNCRKTTKQMRELCPLHEKLVVWARHHIILQAEAILEKYGGC